MNPKLKQYLPPIFLVAGLFLVYALLIPPKYTFNADSYMIRATIGAFIFGGLVGVTEIASRYRDEPFKALRSPFGLIYIVVNGFLSILAAFLIYHFASQYFQSVASDSLLVAIVAGFGATAIMRTRIAVIKSPDGKDISIGPDFVLGILLQVIDINIDRWRSVRRQNILSVNFNQIRGLGDFPTAWRYLMASLLAFQNLDDARKKTLTDTYNDYQAQGERLPEDIKRLGLGFLFLTLVGESNFKSVLDGAASLSKDASTAKPASLPPPPPPGTKPPAGQNPSTTTPPQPPPSPKPPASEPAPTSSTGQPEPQTKPAPVTEKKENANPAQPASPPPAQPSKSSDSAAAESTQKEVKPPAPATGETPQAQPELPKP